MATEIGALRGDGLALALASMGPSSDGDGNARAGAVVAAHEDASMGPSSDGDGNTVIWAPLAVPGTRLQWGRRLMATEIRYSMIGRSAPVTLQWGRRLMATEIGRGAHRVDDPVLPLQWGRRLMATEIRSSPSRTTTG